MKASEQYFPVVLFITLHTVVITFDRIGQNLYAVEQKKQEEREQIKTEKRQHNIPLFVPFQLVPVFLIDLPPVRPVVFSPVHFLPMLAAQNLTH